MRANQPDKIKAWRAGLKHCPQCGQEMTIQHVDGTLARHRMSKDHILPRHWGGGGVGKYARNTRWICQECNNHRAACGHCVGALACVQQVASESCISVSAVLRRWKMGKVAALIVVPGSGVPKQTFRKPSPMEVEHAE